MTVNYTGINRLVFDSSIRNGKPYKFFRVKYDSPNSGRSSSKTFSIKKYGSKKKAYNAALAFHKKCYPFYKPIYKEVNVMGMKIFMMTPNDDMGTQ